MQFLRTLFSVITTTLVLLIHLPAMLLLYLFRRRALAAFVGHLLVRLGPVYIKLAQVLSTRQDVLSPDYLAAFAQLREQVPPENPAAIRRILDAAYPDGIDSVFSQFDHESIAAGSVAQVHRATLKDGTSVAVKILRPNVRRRIEGNFHLIFFLVRSGALFSRNLRAANIVGMIAELQGLLLSQTDLTDEGNNFLRFAEAYREDRDVVIPQVYMAISSSNVLVTEFVEATHPDNYATLGVDGATLAKRLDGLLDTMIFIRGLFHADLHPGNFFWNADAQIVLIDLGLVHDIPQIDRNHIITFYYSIIDGYYEFATEYFLDYLACPRATATETETVTKEDREHAFRSAFTVIDEQYRLTNGHPKFAVMFNQLLGVLARHKLELRAGYTNIFLTLITVEGYLYSLDPNFDMVENARRKRIEDNEYTSVPEEAMNLVLGESGTYSTAYFKDTDNINEAYAKRNQFLLDDCLQVETGKRMLDIGCGRGHLLLEAKKRGADILGITISPYEQQVCTDKGIEVVHTSWEDFEEDHGDRYARHDYISIVEVLSHLGSLHENRVGLVAKRLDRLIAWLHKRLVPGGKVYLQELTIDYDFLTNPQREADYQRLTEDLPWVGFTMLEQIETAADERFRITACHDHSADLVPTYDYFLGQIDHHDEKLRQIMRPDMLDMVRKEIVAYREYSEQGVLKLHRVVLESIG
ncbi:MAG TPA: methyltransferase domain-containing protein [Chromatiaceae bacterium]|nr:methyltransferase domain-containing protein [Chromatiaceae bacterium]HIN82533.1 methyltransferase domain-containing protein [Chromatiales bacterium]HIO13690.1 methyltransferase domain-containing protein [Chromatiales bacterium]